MKNALSIVQRADDKCPQSFLGFKSPLGKVEGILLLSRIKVVKSRYDIPSISFISWLKHLSFWLKLGSEYPQLLPDTAE